MRKIEFKIKADYNKSDRWEDIIPLAFTATDKNLDEVLAFLKTGTHVWEIRYNYEDSSQGHYVPVNKFE